MKALTLLLLLVTHLCTVSTAGGEGFSIHGFGDLFTSQIKARNGEEWFGVFKTEDSTVLESGSVTITNIPGETGSADESSRSRMVFTTKAKSYTWDDMESAPIFLVKGKQLVSGAVETLSVTLPHENSNPLWLGIEQTFRPFKPWAAAISEPWTRLYATGSVAASNVEGEPYDSEYCLHVKNGSRTQKLFCESSLATHPPSVVWAGDMNRDGKLDLVLDASGHESASELHLYISGSTTLLTLEGEFHSSGC